MISHIESLKIDCDFKIEEDRFPSIKNLYTCNAKVLKDPENSQNNVIASVIGEHLKGKNNCDVQSFIVRDQSYVTSVPRGIHKFFPNLIAIHFHQTGLEGIESEDFYGLPKIKSFDFLTNKIVFIGDNVFKYQNQQNIIGLSLNENPIKSIGNGAFTNLTNLKLLHFYLTPCMNGGTEHSENKAQTAVRILKEAAEKCPPSKSKINQTKTVKRTEKYLTSQELSDQIEEKIRETLSKMSKCDEKSTSFNPIKYVIELFTINNYKTVEDEYLMNNALTLKMNHKFTVIIPVFVALFSCKFLF